MFPLWLHVLSLAAVLLGLVCAVILMIDVVRYPQPMGIMNVVWPVTALFGTVVILWLYIFYSRSAHSEMHHDMHEHGMHGINRKPFPVIVGEGTLHCGSGCVIGDIAAECLAFFFPQLAIWFGWHWLFADKMYAVWVFDFVLAFGLGVLFQYFAIAPMRKLSLRAGLAAALEADALSLIAWQIGMYGFMAFAQFRVFGHFLGAPATVDTVEFWFAMQLAMVVGFVASYPVNWWLIRSGIKAEM
jgi:hypothetical protein